MNTQCNIHCNRFSYHSLLSSRNRKIWWQTLRSTYYRIIKKVFSIPFNSKSLTKQNVCECAYFLNYIILWLVISPDMTPLSFFVTCCLCSAYNLFSGRICWLESDCKCFDIFNFHLYSHCFGNSILLFVSFGIYLDKEGEINSTEKIQKQI